MEKTWFLGLFFLICVMMLRKRNFWKYVGSVPVVVGAPNIQDFAPSHGSLLHIRGLQDVDPVAKTMKYLAENPDAYNQSLRYINIWVIP